LFVFVLGQTCKIVENGRERERSWPKIGEYLVPAVDQTHIQPSRLTSSKMNYNSLEILSKMNFQGLFPGMEKSSIFYFHIEVHRQEYKGINQYQRVWGKQTL
jgi:hypothetical protein